MKVNFILEIDIVEHVFLMIVNYLVFNVKVTTNQLVQNVIII